MAAKFCHICGAPLYAGGRFCEKCGTAVLNEPGETMVPRGNEFGHQVVNGAVPVSVVERREMPVKGPAAAPVRKKRGHRPRGVLRTILAVFLCILIFLCSTVALVLLSVRTAVSQENMQVCLERAVEDLDLDEIPAAGLIPDAGEDDSVMDCLIGLAEANGLKLKKRDVEKLLEDSVIVDALCEKMSLYVEDICADTTRAAIDDDDIRNALERDRALISEIFDESMSDREIENITEFVDDSGALEIFNVRELKKAAPAIYYSVQYGLSYWVIGLLGVLVLVWIVLLALVNRWSLTRITGDLGITLTVVGVVVLVPAVFASLLMGSLLKGVPGGNLIAQLVSRVLMGGQLYNLIVLGVGVVLIVVSCVIRAITKKRMKTAA